MRHNRELRDQQLAEAACQVELARRAHDRARGKHAWQEFMERLARGRERGRAPGGHAPEA